MRAAGSRAADYAAVTRIECPDTEREDAEQWEEELVLARSGDAYLRAEVERQVMYDAGGARSWKDDDDGAPVPLARPTALSVSTMALAPWPLSRRRRAARVCEL